jgi:hypothetical protein
MFIDSEVMKSVVGHTVAAAGAAGGLGVHYDVKQGGDASAGTVTAEAELNEASLDRAKAINGNGDNKIFEQIHAPQSNSLASAESKVSKAEEGYAHLFSKRGLLRATPKGPTFVPNRRRHDMSLRALSHEVNKNPLLRIRQRHYLALRRTFDEILHRRKIAINPEMLPQNTKNDIIENAMKTGEQITPLGPTAQVVKRAPQNLRQAFSKWGNALVPGSYIDGPTMKRQG